MRSEDVVEMIDAITEGRDYDHIWQSETDPLHLAVREEMVLFHDGEGFIFQIRDPRTAREIAGALVAWANRKEGTPITSELKPTTSIPEEVVKRQQAIYERGNFGSHADWYRRSVKHMGQEAKDRNLRDLLAILNGTMIGPDESADISAAIQILRDAGAK